MEIYVVQPNDTVESIAEKFQIERDLLIFDNQLVEPYRLAIGQALLISSGEEEIRNKRPVTVIGYAYPFISSWVLEQTLPYLTSLVVFSYGFTPDGNLIPPVIDDMWMVESALQRGARPVIALTPLGEDGSFNNNLISALLENPSAQRRLIWELGREMNEKGYQGVDVDFEYVKEQDKELYVQFIQMLQSVMSVFGYPVSIALAPKTATDQSGVLVEGLDYQALGAAADQVLLMTYEWGYTYGPPMAVAPLSKVREVVEYAVTQIPADKILLGIPNYGYNWTLPYEEGVSRARTVGHVEAVSLAVEHGAEIFYDEDAQSPYFRYEQNGEEHEVWFEDVRSLKAKFDLADEFNLKGMGYWQLAQFFRANWLMLSNRFWIEKNR